MQLIVRAYPQALQAAETKGDAIDLSGEAETAPTRLIRARMPDSGLPVWLVDCPTFFNRPGLYRDPAGNDWPDNAQRFAHFSRVAARLAVGHLVPKWRADVAHANDWHTGFFRFNWRRNARTAPRPCTRFTILPTENVFTQDGIKFYGKVSFLKASIRFSDRVTTVSPSYAPEILTPEYGCGLDGLLRSPVKRLGGILNGVNYSVWDPSTDIHLPANFAIDDLEGKRVCKAELQRELDLDILASVPLVIWLSRITDQNMADVVINALHRLLDRDIQLAVLGEGEPTLEEQFRDAAQHYRRQLAVRIGYEEPLAHRLQAGADMLLTPAGSSPVGSHACTPCDMARFQSCVTWAGSATPYWSGKDFKRNPRSAIRAREI